MLLDCGKKNYNINYPIPTTVVSYKKGSKFLISISVKKLNILLIIILYKSMYIND